MRKVSKNRRFVFLLDKRYMNYQTYFHPLSTGSLNDSHIVKGHCCDSLFEKDIAVNTYFQPRAYTTCKFCLSSTIPYVRTIIVIPQTIGCPKVFVTEFAGISQSLNVPLNVFSHVILSLGAVVTASAGKPITMFHNV